MGTPRVHLAAAVDAWDGFVFALGGTQVDASGSAFTSGAVEYRSINDPPLGPWTDTPATDLSAASYDLTALAAAVTVASPGAVVQVRTLGGISDVGSVVGNSFYLVGTGFPGASASGWSIEQAALLSPVARAAAATSRDGKFVFLLGGGDSDGGAVPTCQQLDVDHDPAWQPCPPLREGRQAFGAAIGSDDRLYAVGGFAGSTVLGSVEVLPLRTGDGGIATVALGDGGSPWLIAPPLGTPRGDVAVVADGHYILAIGGVVSTPTGAPSAVVEALDVDDLASGWVAISPLPAPRAGLAAIVGFDGQVWAIGGQGSPVSPAGGCRVLVSPLLSEIDGLSMSNGAWNPWSCNY